jgi:hypothetical protein
MAPRLPGRSWAGKAMLVVIVLLAAVAAAACSGGSARSATSGSGDPNSAALAFARCMRSHGITDFPDPNAQGGFSAPNGMNVKSPQYAAANNACKSLDGSATPPPYNPATVAALVKYADCMRAHGLSWFPDPDARGHLDVSFPKGTGPGNPQYTAANKACSAGLPGGGGSGGNGP